MAATDTQMALAPIIPPLAALLAWIPISLFFFYRFPPRIAVLLNFVGGWALLPTASFAPSESVSPFPYWIMGVCLPTKYFVTKATITGLAGILGVLLIDWRGLRRFRPTLWDLPIFVWCAAPFFSGLANAAPHHGALWEGVRGTAYLVLAWGVPYLLGRVYFGDNESLTLAAKAFVIAGLCYVPISLVELFTGPRFYAFLYGFQPYRWLGAERYLGYRPIGFLEDGNQLGIWMAVATLCAAGLWKQGRISRVLGFPTGWAAVVLFCTTIICQSVGSIICVIGLLPLVLVTSLTFRRGVVIVCALFVLCFAGLRLANVISLRHLVESDEAARATASFFVRIGRQSFGWRLAQDERHVRAALAKPLLGSGQWDWWRDGEGRPWGLWLLTFGMYGGVGLIALEGMQFLPAIGAVWLPAEPDNPGDAGALPEPSTASRNTGLRLGLAAAILLAAIDKLLNGDMIMPLVLVIGGLSLWKAESSTGKPASLWNYPVPTERVISCSQSEPHDAGPPL
ncbi:MAG: hypothetical protein JO300_12005 [Silvibacterium sp.]|nr:hypothetical protein [Silvibacterium sp.]